LSKSEERIFVDPPRTIYGSTSIPDSFSLIMKVDGLRQMLEGLEDEDSFRIEVFAGNRATEYSYLKK
ncbi:MAG: hypothetical protein KAR06_01315, partial [Deltaproteobacteria bacterium]|nr:hypothetical protein [Deltaproteobacteria bacterium]